MNQHQITVEDLARKLKPILGKRIDEIYFRYLNAGSLEEKSEILQLLAGLYQKHLSKLLDKDFSLEPPKEDSLKGEYPLAKVAYAGKTLFDFNLRGKDWPRHVCITGMSGSGKTTFALNILKNFIKKDKPFLVFDWKKSFRPLMKEDPNVMCFTVGNGAISNLFKTNINRPPKGVNPKEWINTLCDLLTESFNVSFGVHKILLETLDETFQGWGVYENSNLYPNWEHIKRMLEVKARDSKGRETGWYESALRIATVLTFGEFGKVVNYDGKKSLSFEDLFDKKVIFELNSLSNIEKKFFCEFILTYIYKLKKAGNEKASQEFNHAILVDEAHNIFLKKEPKFMSESVTDMIYREMREYGTSLICLDQHASKLSDTVIGNSACHVAFQQQLPQDLEEISSLMQLRDKKEIFTQLPVGSAIVKLSERHTSPFLIEVPFTDLRDLSVEDSKVKTKMNCVIEGYEIEKNDPEFKEKIIYKENLTAKKPLVTSSIKPKKEEILVEELNQTQKVLLEFVKSKLSEDKKLNEIEKLLDSGIDSGYYSKKDVLVVINIALSWKLNFNKSKPSVRKAESVEIKKTLSENLTKEELSFVNFLMGNSNHCMSTVELYKSMGLSSRKGNVIKEKLFQKGILKIEEERNEKGWRKLIKLSNSYSL
ncbi:hypothetical protein COT60_02530 [Candidatus Pacearchaeota archaeon CG09_land_8_20_14_0_10_30_9]|nr:ATP-binding protein [Candidatus Pacearchaeota archaeon]PIO01040.1 MAG: hypothetical protein COT60_02530 [Candidatus Pacearchaeota archaeon CG09_land_8_20_14_0_10_30_9]PIZ82277.1 MAG: hypothetical protein COX98_00330 [Candidatus Pacearchaeota archaeon CG_4_10_14_0_2_um_filter_30_11]